MATWTARPAAQGTPASSWEEPGSPDSAPSTMATPSPTHSPCMDSSDPMEDSGFHDWLESQMSVTGEMSVVERLQYLLDTGQFADVNIRVGQGNNVVVFKAHRLLLATASQPLYRLVYAVNPHPSPTEVTTIRVHDMLPKDFEPILKYIYTDSVDCSDIKVAFELLRASKRWGLAGLGIKSLNYLEGFIDDFEPSTEEMKTNLFDLLVLSEKSLNDMCDKCWQIISKHANEIIPCEGFLRLERDIIRKMLMQKDLKFDDQLKLFEAIRDWGLRYVREKGLKMTQLGDVVEDLIKVVDFDKISDRDFVNTVLTSECLGKAEVIAFFMTHGLEIPRNLDFNNNKQLPFWLWFCATSDPELKERRGSKGGPATTHKDKKASHNHLTPVAETVNKITSLTQNGSLLEFNKVCRFRKGYRCPQKEIYQSHELRFRVDKNIKLLGVGFGFLFSSTDMGVTVHCQGPWETRQWTDIEKTYCRVSGEKQETADVRLMFSTPVRIEANQCYKVMVKIGRMSSGSSDVELWGGTGGMHYVETEDAEFFFIKAAVDPNKRVEESEGDVKPGVITELLYQLDTGEEEKPVERRRRPQPQEEEQEAQPVETTGRRRRPETLKVPEIPYARKRSPPSGAKSPDAPPATRRREGVVSYETSPSYSSRRTSMEEYKPESFSTNRWRTRSREEDSDTKKSYDTSTKIEEYKPSSFSTNRWRTRSKPEDSEIKKTEDTERKASVEEYMPTSFSTNRWRVRPKPEDSETKKTEERKTSTDEYKPDSFSTNRWRSRRTEDDASKTQDTSSSKTTTDEYKPQSFVTNRWRTRATQPEEPKDTVFGNKVFSGTATTERTSHPFMRRRESETKTTEIPFYLRKQSTEDNRSALSKNRWATTADDRHSRDTTTRSLYSRDKDTSSVSSSLPRPSDSLSLRSRDLSSSRFGSTRDSSLSRVRDSSLSRTSTREPSLSRIRDPTTSRFGSTYSSSFSRYDSPSTQAGRTDVSSSSTGSRYSQTADTSKNNALSRYGLDSPASGGLEEKKYGSRYGTSSTIRPYTGASSAGRLTSSSLAHGSDSGATSRGSRYGTASTGSSDTSAGSRYGLSSTSGDKYGTSSLQSRSDTSSKGTGSKYGISGASDTSKSSPSSRYGSSTSTGTRDAGRTGLGSSLSSYGSSGSGTSKTGSRFGSTYGTGSTSAPPTRLAGGSRLLSYSSGGNKGTNNSENCSRFCSH
ncbi:nuclear pore complex protein DDB_G0274915 isoform X2 [Penaeus vannamei]|uniref:nuclear pore complex protein DDB_G0274915 isoform X2 n=1 Tax=Penaeus vannamei TaxID=6689 RepID=UPI00387F6297